MSAENRMDGVNGVRECCKDDRNLRIVASDAMRTTMACVVCNAKHYEMTVDAADLRARLLAGLNGGDGTPGD